MPKIPDLTALGANVDPEDFVLLVQGGATKRIKVKNLLKGVVSLALSNSPPGSDETLLVRGGVPYRITTADWINSAGANYDFTGDWVTDGVYLMRDGAANPLTSVMGLGASATGGSGTITDIAATTTTPGMLSVASATANQGFYHWLSGCARGFSTRAALCFAGVSPTAVPAVNCRITVGLASTFSSTPLSVPLVNPARLLCAVVDSRISNNWHLMMANGTAVAPFTTDVLDTGIALTTGYQSIGIVWDPLVGLSFVHNGVFITTLVPAAIAKYQAQLLFPGVSYGCIATSASSGCAFSHYYGMFARA